MRPRLVTVSFLSLHYAVDVEAVEATATRCYAQSFDIHLNSQRTPASLDCAWNVGLII